MMNKIEQVEATAALLTERTWGLLATAVESYPRLAILLVITAAFGPLFLAASWD